MKEDTVPARVSREQLEYFCLEAMRRCGMTPEDARVTADVLVTTDTWGVHSHGTKALRMYLKRLRAGGLKARGVPKVVAEGPAWAVMDGDNSMAMVSSCRAMEVAIAKAKPADVLILDVRPSDEAKAGMIPGAKNLPADEIENRVSEIPKDKKIVAYCATGVQADMVYNVLKERGYPNVSFVNVTLTVEPDGTFTRSAK